MNISKYILLIHKKLKGKLSDPEKRELEEWLDKEGNQNADSQLSHIWDLSSQYKSDYEPDTEKGLSRLKDRMRNVRAEAKPTPVRQLGRHRMIRWAAAAAILLVSIGWWYSQTYLFSTEQIVSAPAEQIRELTLPDGSTVVLNVNSSLNFPKSFKGDKFRLVQFEGEAYFKIKPNPEQPFLILTDQAEVKILGTSFNLRAYPEESFTEVEVEEGLVLFQSRKDREKGIELKANDRCSISHNGRSRQLNGQNQNAHSWRTQSLTFQKTPMIQVVNALERHYKIDIELSDELRRCSFNTNFDAETRLEDVWAQIELSTGADVNIEPDQPIRITGEGLSINDLLDLFNSAILPLLVSNFEFLPNYS